MVVGSFLFFFFFKWLILFVFVPICSVGKSTYMLRLGLINCGKIFMIHIDKVVLTSVGVSLSIGIPQSIEFNTLVMVHVLSCYQSIFSWYNLHSIRFGNLCMVPNTCI